MSAVYMYRKYVRFVFSAVLPQKYKGLTPNPAHSCWTLALVS